MSWLIHQILLTGHELEQAVTIPKIVTGLVMYTLIHKIARTGDSLEAHVIHKRRTAVKLHVYENHPAKLSKCQQGECQVLAADLTEDAV